MTDWMRDWVVNEEKEIKRIEKANTYFAGRNVRLAKLGDSYRPPKQWWPPLWEKDLRFGNFGAVVLLDNNDGSGQSRRKCFAYALEKHVTAVAKSCVVNEQKLNEEIQTPVEAIDHLIQLEENETPYSVRASFVWTQVNGEWKKMHSHWSPRKGAIGIPTKDR